VSTETRDRGPNWDRALFAPLWAVFNIGAAVGAITLACLWPYKGSGWFLAWLWLMATLFVVNGVYGAYVMWVTAEPPSSTRT
jgi:hypothetical protein